MRYSSRLATKFIAIVLVLTFCLTQVSYAALSDTLRPSNAAGNPALAYSIRTTLSNANGTDIAKLTKELKETKETLKLSQEAEDTETRITGLQRKIREIEHQLLPAVFGVFDTPDTIADGQFTINDNNEGRINTTYILTVNGRKYVIQNLGDFFDPEAIEYQLITLEMAQDEARKNGLFEPGQRLEYWQAVHYYNIRETEDTPAKHLYLRDDKGKISGTWRIMEFVEGEIYNELDDPKNPMPDDLRAQAPVLAAQGLRDFAFLMSFAPIERLRKNKRPLPFYHNTGLHVREVRGLRNSDWMYVLPSRKDKLRQARMIPGLLDEQEYGLRTKQMFDIFYFLSSLTNDYSNPEVDKIISDMLIHTLAHNDPKINNMVWRKNPKTGKWHVACLIDNDTLQLESMKFIDFGDLGRSMSNPVGENPWLKNKSLRDVKIDWQVLDEYVEGYMQGLTKDEKTALRPHLYWAVAKISFELGLRFFKAFISEERNGRNAHGVYFQLQPGDPKDKFLRAAEVQFKIALEILNKHNATLNLQERGVHHNLLVDYIRTLEYTSWETINPAQATATGTAEKLKQAILIINPNDMNISGLKQEYSGYRILEANNAASARSIIQETNLTEVLVYGINPLQFTSVKNIELLLDASGISIVKFNPSIVNLEEVLQAV